MHDGGHRLKSRPNLRLSNSLPLASGKPRPFLQAGNFDTAGEFRRTVGTLRAFLQRAGYSENCRTRSQFAGCPTLLAFFARNPALSLSKGWIF